MAKKETYLTDKQWEKISKILPKRKVNPKGGRKPAGDRDAFEGIIWVLKSGARWKDLPNWYPSPATCWRRLRLWEDQGVWLRLWRSFLRELDARGQLDWEETFADGSFAPAKKGGSWSEKPSVARVRSGWWWSMARESLSVLISIRPRRLK